MASQLAIINVALSRVGANDISSLTEGTTEQKLAVKFWDVARRACLRDYPWNFALTDVELGQVTGYVPFEYPYAYELPADNVRLLQVYGNPTFKVQGRRVLTSQATCKIKYVRDVTDPTEFNPSFDDVLAQRLAVDMGYALTKSQATADSMFQIYQLKLKAARHIDSTENTEDPLGGNSSIYIAARY